MIENYGWRMAYIGFAAAVFALALPMAVFIMKETPAEMGLQPDGGPASDAGDDNSVISASPRLHHAGPAPGSEHAGAGPAVVSRAAGSVADNSDGAEHTVVPVTGLSCPQAARTRSFWLILFSFMLVGIGITSVIAHLVPMLTDRGVAPATAALCMSSLALGLIAGRLLSGFLMDYFFAPYVAAFFLLGLLGGIIILATGTAGALVFVAAICVGMATGSEISEIAYICSRYFGPRAFGLIYGFMFAAFQLGSMVGSPLMGLYYDRAGDYIGALWIVGVIVLVGTVLIVLLGPYPRGFPDVPGAEPAPAQAGQG